MKNDGTEEILCSTCGAKSPHGTLVTSNDGGSTFTCAACKPLIAPMTDEQAKAKIIAMLVSCREFCSDPDMRNSFLGWKDRSLGRELLPRGLAKLAAHIVFEQSEEGLDKMREAFDAAISAISTTTERIKNFQA